MFYLERPWIWKTILLSHAYWAMSFAIDNHPSLFILWWQDAFIYSPNYVVQKFNRIRNIKLKWINLYAFSKSFPNFSKHFMDINSNFKYCNLVENWPYKITFGYSGDPIIRDNYTGTEQNLIFTFKLKNCIYIQVERNLI